MSAAFAAVLLTALLANAAQTAIGRVRPNRAPSHLTFVPPFSQLWTKQEVCFPSGEAATAFALAGVLTRLYRRGRVLFYAASALAAVSRLVNGAHYVSDVAAGALLGALLADACFRLANRLIAARLGTAHG
jgi:undecaprenyl-diphosphatase